MMTVWEMMMQSDKINEAVSHNDLRSLIDNVVSVDQYKSKIGKDENVVVVAFKVKDKDPAHDLSQFLETGHETVDVDISPGPDTDGKYTVFIELERNHNLFDKIEKILNDISKIDNDASEWKFSSYENKNVQDWTKESFNNSVITNSYDYTVKHNPDAKAIAERIKFLNSY